MRERSCLTETDAALMMAACRAEADKNNWKVTIAIVDEGGYLLRLERMDGANPNSPEIALAKARTSALTGLPSKTWQERLKEFPGALKFPNVLPVPGGVPIFHNSERVGAIGVSGVTSYQDEQIASAGVAALQIGIVTSATLVGSAAGDPPEQR